MKEMELYADAIARHVAGCTECVNALVAGTCRLYTTDGRCITPDKVAREPIQALLLIAPRSDWWQDCYPADWPAAAAAWVWLAADRELLVEFKRY